jgi:nitroreductase
MSVVEAARNDAAWRILKQPNIQKEHPPMSTLHDILLTQLNWRYATKRFNPDQKISDKDWHVLTESLRLAPSSFGLQPWQFIVVQNDALRKTLRPLSWNQSQIEDCSHLVVFTTLKTMTPDYINAFIQKTADVRQGSVENLAGYRDMMVASLVNSPKNIQEWGQRQSYIAMGMLLQSAALLQIDTCAIEGIDPKAYDKVLELENSPYATVAVVALGYRHEEDPYQHQKKVRFEHDQVIKTLP